MNIQEARHRAHELLESVLRYKRWHYRKIAIEKFIPLLEQEGIKIEVKKNSISCEKHMAHGETYRIVFRDDRTIRCEVSDKKGVLAIPISGTLKDYLAELLTGVSLVTS